MAGFIVKHFTAGGNGYRLLFMFYVKDKDEKGKRLWNLKKFIYTDLGQL